MAPHWWQTNRVLGSLSPAIEFSGNCDGPEPGASCERFSAPPPGPTTMGIYLRTIRAEDAFRKTAHGISIPTVKFPPAQFEVMGTKPSPT